MIEVSKQLSKQEQIALSEEGERLLSFAAAEDVSRDMVCIYPGK